MMIRCPKCDRVGHLPDRLAPEARRLRCRRCNANFSTAEVAVKSAKPHRGADDSWRGAAIDPSTAGSSRQILGKGIFGRFDEPATTLRSLGPGDSNYEMAFSLDDPRDDSGADWEKEGEDFFEAEAPSSDEIEAIRPGQAEPPRPESWYYGFIVAWAKPLCIGVLGFVAFSVLVIGFLVASSLGVAGPQIIPTSIQALIVASLGTIALLMIGVSMIFQSVFLADLARNVKRMPRSEDRLSRG